MKLTSIIEKFGLPGNLGRDLGEKFIKDFIKPGLFAELWTKLEEQFDELKPKLDKTFEKTNDLFKYIKPEKGDETYRVSSLPEAEAQELLEYLEEIIKATDEASNIENIDEETANKIIEFFDGIFSEMLEIFTSNTGQQDPLDPYKQTKIGFKESKIMKKTKLKQIIRKYLLEQMLNEIENCPESSEGGEACYCCGGDGCEQGTCPKGGGECDCSGGGMVSGGGSPSKSHSVNQPAPESIVGSPEYNNYMRKLMDNTPEEINPGKAACWWRCMWGCQWEIMKRYRPYAFCYNSCMGRCK